MNERDWGRMTCERCLEAVKKTYAPEEAIYGVWRNKKLCEKCRVFRRALAVKLVEEHDAKYPPGESNSQQRRLMIQRGEYDG